MQHLTADSPAAGQATDIDAVTVAMEYPKESIVSYAQTHEDVLLWRALYKVPHGFYVDVGAHDPTELSVTKAFYERGWHGINIEPVPSYAMKLRKERPRDVTYEVALGEVPGTTTIYDFGNTGLSTLVKGIADEHLAAGMAAKEYRVPVTTLTALLGDLGDQEVHFLKIDVEGFELQVLGGADFEKVRPWIVLVEALKPLSTLPSYETWEPLLLKAGYEFAYFDGINRFYVAREHLYLKHCFSAPVSTCDPFQDNEVVRLSTAVAALEQEKVQHATLLGDLSGLVVNLERESTAQASEAVRLNEIIVQLEHDKKALERDKETQATELARLRQRAVHEQPQLGGDPPLPIACQIDDLVGLLRIVESQASHLVRLRRALLGTATIAAQRLELIRKVENATVPGANEVLEWLRSILVDEIYQMRISIARIVERSRWRRIGQRFGLSRRLNWERGNWRTAPVEAGGELVLDDRIITLPISALLTEFERLHGFLSRLKSSRWRRLGQRLGLAKRFPWETGAKHESLLTKPFPASVAGAYISSVSTEGTTQSGYERWVEYMKKRFLEECRSYSTDVIFDVGANTGQFAQGLRAAGYNGPLISFEPLSNAHAKLVEVSASDPLWDVVDRCAVGARDGWANINIAGNSFSSSLLDMLDLHREAAPESVYKGTEPCSVTTLDTYVEQTFSDPTTLIGLKIDTQGYEAEVLAGMRRNHSRVKVILCEMSLAPLYNDGPSMSKLCHLLAELDYHCVALSPEFEHPKTGELLQVDGIFVKRD